MIGVDKVDSGSQMTVEVSGISRAAVWMKVSIESEEVIDDGLQKGYSR